MDIAAESEQVPDYPLDVSMAAFADMAKILSALGNEDALAIFIYAKNGIESSKDAIRVLGLTQKKFYSRLKDLIDNKLIEKNEGMYRHTALGEILLKMGLSMEELIINKDKLSILNKLNKTKNISEKERKQLMQIFSLDILSPFKEVQIISSFEELVLITTDMIKICEKELLLATQYIDNRVINEGLNALNRGVIGRIIVSKMDQFSRAFKILLSLITNPKQIAVFTSLLKSSEIQIKCINLPYTFIIADDEKCIVEIIDLTTSDFKFAMFFQNITITNKMKEMFESYWEKAEDLKQQIHI